MVRTILHYPDARLREPGKKVEALTPELRQLIDDMAETMYAAPGVGLAATQVGELWQIFVVDCATEGEPSDLRVFVNPEILSTEGTTTFDEGCLSFPGAREEVERAEKVRVRAQDRDGKWFELEAEGSAGHRNPARVRPPPGRADDRPPRAAEEAPPAPQDAEARGERDRLKCRVRRAAIDARRLRRSTAYNVVLFSAAEVALSQRAWNNRVPRDVSVSS